jgi:ComF family protein
VECTYLCEKCLTSIPISKGITCFICGRRSPQGYVCRTCHKKSFIKLDGLLVASEWHNSLLKKIIYAYKYNFIKELGVPLSIIASEYLRANFLYDKQEQDIVFVSVPLHPRRLAWRDFDQAKLLTKNISETLTIPVAENILIKNRHTLPQAKINNRIEREINLKNAFSLTKSLTEKNKKILKNKIIILVDDVATTGTTLQECAKTLRPLSPREIWGLVIARG